VLLLKTPVEISAQQIEAFAKLYRHYVRPLQPLNPTTPGLAVLPKIRLHAFVDASTTRTTRLRPRAATVIIGST
jgi:hypothetical protein